MKKRFIGIILCVCLLLSTIIVATSCKGEEELPTGHEHSYGEWIQTTAPTCTADGQKTRTCSGCGEVETELIPALGHDWGDWVVTTLSTEDAEGVKTRTCNRCSAKETASVDKLSEHTFNCKVTNSNTLASKANCTSPAKYFYSCACGAIGTETFEYGSINVGAHTFTIDESLSSAATCIADGHTHKTCENCGLVQDVVVKAKGHKFNIAAATCTEAKVCTVCNHLEEAALEHDYQFVKKVDKTCLTDGYDEYKCSHCDAIHKENVDFASGYHSFGAWEDVSSVATGKKDCEFSVTSQAECAVCKHVEIATRTEIRHNYNTVISDVATCCTAGHTLQVCSICGDNKNGALTEYTDADAHDWDDGTPTGSNNATLFTCSHCTTTKTIIAAKNDFVATVSADDLTAVGALELSTAAITMGSGTTDLFKDKTNVEIKAEKKAASEYAGLTLPTGFDASTPVFDFTMTIDGNPQSDLGGKVTITLPYELGETDDPENIVVYYINSEGELSSFFAKYSNGFVTFETDHFSYYTVTRLTNAERCALYGHNYKEVSYNKTCTEDAYTYKLCVRCGHSDYVVTEKATGHNFISQSKTNPTCTENGKETFKCEYCTATKAVFTKATGHNYAENGHLDATCAAEGYTSFACTNTNCTSCYKVIIAALPHSFTDEVVAPACDSYGYTKHTCSVCHTVITDSQVEPLGHVWDREAPDCGHDQTCLICGKVGASALGNHQMLNGVCAICGEGCNHSYKVTTIAPSCTNKGYTSHTCTICGNNYKSDYKAQLSHNYVDGKCSACGKEEFASADSREYYANLFESILSTDFYLKVENFSMSLGYYSTYNNSAFKFFSKLNNGEAYLTTNENGELYGLILFGLDTTSASTYLGDLYSYGYTEYYTGKFAIKGNKIYAQVMEDDVAMYTTYDLKELVGEEYADYLNRLPEVYDFLMDEILPTINTLMVFDSLALDNSVTALLENIFSSNELGGKKYISIDFEDLIDLVKVMQDGTPRDVFDYVFGEGFSDSVIEDLKAAPDWTMDYIVDEIEKRFDLDEFIDIIFDIIDEVETNEDFAPLMDLYHEVISDKSINDFLEDMICEVFSDISGEQKTAKDMVNEILTGAKYRNYTVVDILVEFAGITDREARDFFEYITTPVEKFFDIIIYDECEGLFDDYLLPVLESIKDSVKLELVTDTTGNLISAQLEAVDAVATIYDETITINTLISFVEPFVTTTTIDEIVDDVTAHTNIPDLDLQTLLKQAVADNDDLDIVYDIDGNITYIYWSYEIGNYSYVCEAEDIETEATTVTSVRVDLNNPDRIRLYTISYHYSGHYSGNYRSGCSNLDVYYNINTKKAFIDFYSLNQCDHDWIEDVSLRKEATGCTGIGKKYYTCSICGETKVEDYVNGHADIQCNAEFLTQGSHNCEDGVRMTYTCGVCGEEIISYVTYSHEEACLYRYYEDLLYDPDFDCQHNIRIFKCACEQNSYFDFSGSYISACNECGLSITKNESQQKDENIPCLVHYKGVVTFAKNGKNVTSISYAYSKYVHNTRWFVELSEGSETCEDGCFETYKCVDCGYVGSSYTYHSHNTGVREVIDLAQYGCTCGGCAYIRGCACGYYNYDVEFDCNCDLDYDTFDSNTPHFSWYYNYVYTCAVTSPKCNFRYAVKYEEEQVDSCHYALYICYYMGCDANGNGGTLLYKYKYTTETAHANLTTTTGELTPVDGVPCLYNMYVGEYCSVCGYRDGYYSFTTDHNQTQHEDGYYCDDCLYGTHTICYENGDTKHRYYIGEHRGSSSYDRYIYVSHYNGEYVDCAYYYITEVDQQFAVQSDDNGTYESLSLTKHEYYYNIDLFKDCGRYDSCNGITDECRRKDVYTNSNGHVSTSILKFDCGTTYTTIVPSTCTQYGYEACRCPFCETEYESYITTPNDHHWISIGDAMGLAYDYYCCRTCGLINSNGADGDVIFEDLTDYTVGFDTYKVGYYYNYYNSLKFIASITILPGDDADAAIYLDGVTLNITGIDESGNIIRSYTEDGHYVTFSKAEVLALAADHGYTDPADFTIRLNFVPENYQGSLDYAITLIDYTADIFDATLVYESDEITISFESSFAESRDYNLLLLINKDLTIADADDFAALLMLDNEDSIVFLTDGIEFSYLDSDLDVSDQPEKRGVCSIDYADFEGYLEYALGSNNYDDYDLYLLSLPMYAFELLIESQFWDINTESLNEMIFAYLVKLDKPSID